MLYWLLSMILGGVEMEMEHPPMAMTCDGPMITMDPTFTAAYVPDGEHRVIYVGITNNCDQDLVLDLEFEPVPADASFGEIRLINDPSDRGIGGVVDDFGLISLRVMLPAYETDVRGLIYFADEIESEELYPSFEIDTRWFDLFVLDDNMQPIFHAETALEITVFDVPEGDVGGGGY